MLNKIKATTIHWTLIFLSIFILPLVPTGIVLLIGWSMPGKISWFYADASFPIGPLASVAACTFLITRNKTIPLLRFLFICTLIFFMSFIARTELIFTKACVTQRGAYIDLQQQQKDIEAAEAANELGCD